MTVLSAVVAFIFAYSLQKSVSDSSMAGFILLGVVAYVALIMSGYTGKWESELKNPYIFLIPDSPLKKMWYATLMEHVKAICGRMYHLHSYWDFLACSGNRDHLLYFDLHRFAGRPPVYNGDRSEPSRGSIRKNRAKSA